MLLSTFFTNIFLRSQKITCLIKSGMHDSQRVGNLISRHSHYTDVCLFLSSFFLSISFRLLCCLPPFLTSLVINQAVTLSHTLNTLFFLSFFFFFYVLSQKPPQATRKGRKLGKTLSGSLMRPLRVRSLKRPTGPKSLTLT